MLRWNNQKRHDSFACNSTAGFALGNLMTHGVFSGLHRESLCERGLPDGFLNQIDFAAAQFTKAVGAPDLVLIKSLYWDLQYLCDNLPASKQKSCAAYTNSSRLMAEMLATFERDLAEVVARTRRAFPGALVGLRTDPPWNFANNRLAFRSNVTAVHQVGLALIGMVRALAEKENLPLFDFFSVFERLPSSKEYLMDDIHITDHFSRIELSVAFSLLLDEQALVKAGR